MRHSLKFVALTFSLLLCGRLYGALWDTVVFRDDFDAEAGLDLGVWGMNHPESWWWVQGRTFFPSPTHHPAGPFPRVDGGVCTIEHHLYNPYDSATTPSTFLGGEIHTVTEFDPTSPHLFEARLRSDSYPNGLVTSFFTYGFDGAHSDEIDFEFLSNATNDGVTFPEGDPALTNPWNESIQNPEYVTASGLDLSEWNTFRMYWYPGERIEWTWLDPINGETLLRTETDPLFVPDEPMNLYFNFWAPTGSWQAAYDESLWPRSDASQNEIYMFEIDYAEVRVPEPLTFTTLAAGAVWLLARRHHTVRHRKGSAARRRASSGEAATWN